MKILVAGQGIEQAAKEVLSLPVHPALSPADLETIVAAVNEFMK